MRFLQRLNDFWRTFKGTQIPLIIADDETILRALFHPDYFNSKKKSLAAEAFLPKAKSEDIEDRKRVSVLRRDYSTDSECKNSALMIRKKKYIGFVAFIGTNLSIVNSFGLGVTAALEYTPMDNKGNYSTRKKHFTGQSGVPMHAEVVYSSPLIAHIPNPAHRAYADHLASILQNSIHEDPNPDIKDWYGPALKYKDASAMRS